MTGVRLSRIFWIGAAAILVVAALIGVAGLLKSDFTETDGQILLTLLALLVSAGTAVAGLTLVARERFIAVGWGAVAVAAVGFVLITATTWESFDEEWLWKLGLTAALALIVTLLGTTQLVLYRDKLGAVVAGTWLALFFAFVFMTAGVLDEPASDGVWKGAGACWILGVLGWLLLPILQRFTAAGAPAQDIRVLASLGDVELVATRAAGGIDVQLGPGERLALRRRA